MKKLLALTIGALLTGPALAAPSVTISVTPTNALGSATPVINWSSAETTTCEASGGWSGTKATMGSEQLPTIFATTTYTLTCYGANGNAVLSWVPPTERTDGSPLTNLGSYNIWLGPTPSGLSVYETILAGGTTYTLNNLPPGMTYFAMSAIDTDGLESVVSNSVSKDIVAPSASNSATVTITSRPNPPVLSAVQSAAVYELQTLGSGEIKLGRQVGELKYDVVCGNTLLFGENYYEVPLEAVQLKHTNIKSEQVVAQCSPSLTLG